TAGLTNIENSMGSTRPELQLKLDNDIASKYGLTFNQVMQTVRTGVNGQVATRMKTDGQEIDVIVLLPEEYRDDINSLRNLRIQTDTGTNIPLSTIGEFHQVETPHSINRQNQERGVSVTADLLSRQLSDVAT